MNSINRYMETALQLLKKVQSTQQDAMQAAAEAVAATLEHGGTIFTFGTGHSHMLAEEVFYRAGGLAKVYPILDEPLMLHADAPRSSMLERLPGYAHTLINSRIGIKEGDVIFLFSNSGRNTVSVEMALEAKEKGMTVICITNLQHSRSVVSRHPSGKRLYEACDIVIDNLGAIGDAAIPIGSETCGPTSTVIGSAIMQAIVCGAVEKMIDDGAEPEVFKSSNVDGGDEANDRYIEKYHPSIRML